MSAWISIARDWLETLGGARPSTRRPTALSAIGWGLWWTLLLAITLAAAGRATKFIYVDF